MKKRLLLAGICLIAIISGCARDNAAAPSEEKAAAVAPTNKENVVENSGGATVAVPKETANTLEKHSKLISYLESEDYQSAETYVHELVIQQKKEAAGDINDYLVKVNLDSKNFEEYFEFVTVPRYNAFGEPDENIGIGVKSKKYDEGLIVYSLDDITVENIFNSFNSENKLQSLLSFGTSFSFYPDDDNVLSYSGRITDGTVTFIKQEYVEDYPIPELKKPDDYYAETTIQLKNGEIITRYLYPEYPY